MQKGSSGGTAIWRKEPNERKRELSLVLYRAPHSASLARPFLPLQPRRYMLCVCRSGGVTNERGSEGLKGRREADAFECPCLTSAKRPALFPIPFLFSRGQSWHPFFSKDNLVWHYLALTLISWRWEGCGLGAWGRESGWRRKPWTAKLFSIRSERE